MKNAYLFFPVLTLFLFSCDPVNIQESFELANTSYEAEDYDSAIKYFRNIQNSDFFDQRSLYRLATALMIKENYSESLALYLEYPEYGAQYSLYRNYNIACIYSLTEQDYDEGMYYLYLAISQGFDDYNYILADPDIQNLINNKIQTGDLGYPYRDVYYEMDSEEQNEIEFENGKISVDVDGDFIDELIFIYGIPYMDPFPNFEDSYLCIYKKNETSEGYRLIYKKDISYSGSGFQEMQYSNNSISKIQPGYFHYDLDEDGLEELLLSFISYFGPCGSSQAVLIIDSNNEIQTTKLPTPLFVKKEQSKIFLFSRNFECGGIGWTTDLVSLHNPQANYKIESEISIHDEFLNGYFSD